MILEKNFQFISKQIHCSTTELHLDTCRKMIEDRIAIWGDWDRVNKLINLIQVREVELMMISDPVTDM